LKHQLVQKILAQKIMRLNNIVKPDRDDIQVAVQSIERAQKKADFEHKKAVEQELRRQQRQRRRK
jgi:aspartate aminotransferase-like enzyme